MDRVSALKNIATRFRIHSIESTTKAGSGHPSSCCSAADIVATLNKEINAALADSRLKARIADLGGVPMPMTPGDFGKHIAAETAKWAKVITFAGIKVK